MMGHADEEPHDDPVRLILRQLHLRTAANISVIASDVGEERRLWESSCRRLVVVDDLRAWRPAKLLGGLLGDAAAAKLRGAALRVRSGRLPRPDVMLVIGAEGLARLQRVRHPRARIVLVAHPDVTVLDSPERSIADVAVATMSAPQHPGVPVVPFGHNGLEARIAGLDTNRASRRTELGIAEGLLIVGVGEPTDEQRIWFEALTAQTDLDGVATACAWLGPTGHPTGALLPHLDRNDIAIADIVVAFDTSPRSASAARSAVLAGAALVFVAAPPDGLVDWGDATIQTGAPNAITDLIALGTATSAARGERIASAWLKFDVESLVQRWEELLTAEHVPGGSGPT